MDILTLPMFLEIIDSILNPKRGDEFYGKFAEERWNAYGQFFVNCEPWLKENYCRVWQIITDETNKILYEFITNELLYQYNWMIQEKAKWFLDGGVIDAERE